MGKQNADDANGAGMGTHTSNLTPRETSSGPVGAKGGKGGSSQGTKRGKQGGK